MVFRQRSDSPRDTSGRDPVGSPALGLDLIVLGSGV